MKYRRRQDAEADGVAGIGVVRRGQEGCAEIEVHEPAAAHGMECLRFLGAEHCAHTDERENKEWAFHRDNVIGFANYKLFYLHFILFDILPRCVIVLSAIP